MEKEKRKEKWVGLCRNKKGNRIVVLLLVLTLLLGLLSQKQMTVYGSKMASQGVTGAESFETSSRFAGTMSEYMDLLQLYTKINQCINKTGELIDVEHGKKIPLCDLAVKANSSYKYRDVIMQHYKEMLAGDYRIDDLYQSLAPVFDMENALFVKGKKIYYFRKSQTSLSIVEEKKLQKELKKVKNTIQKKMPVTIEDNLVLGQNYTSKVTFNVMGNKLSMITNSNYLKWLAANYIDYASYYVETKLGEDYRHDFLDKKGNEMVQWKNMFEQAYLQRSGNQSRDQFAKALVAHGNSIMEKSKGKRAPWSADKVPMTLETACEFATCLFQMKDAIEEKLVSPFYYNVKDSVVSLSYDTKDSNAVQTRIQMVNGDYKTGENPCYYISFKTGENTIKSNIDSGQISQVQEKMKQLADSCIVPGKGQSYVLCYVDKNKITGAKKQASPFQVQYVRYQKEVKQFQQTQRLYYSYMAATIVFLGMAFILFLLLLAMVSYVLKHLEQFPDSAVSKGRKKLHNASARKRYFIPLLVNLSLFLLVFVACLYLQLCGDWEINLFAIIGAGVLYLSTILYLYRSLIYNLEADEKITLETKKIADGDMKHQVDEDDIWFMSKEQEKLVRTINEVAKGMDSAVTKRMQSEKMKTELITNVSHDIKTPLTSIINYVELMKREEIEPQKAREYLAILDKKSQRLKVLIEDLIEASKAASGSIELQMASLNFNELVLQINGEFEERFAATGLTLVTSIPEEKVSFMGDGRRVFRILENLYGNAIKYSMPGTRVYVSLFEKQKEAVFEIKNISAQQLNISAEELTERFVRGEHSRTTQGSGLGLSIAKNLTECMNGKFRIRLDGDLFNVIVSFPVICDMIEE